MQPVLDERIKGRQGYGLIQVVTGDGKGKTTSAIGQCVRTVGAGKRAAIIFFDKGGEHYMERKVFDAFAVEDHERGLGRVEWWAFGRDRVDASGRFDFSITDEDKEFGRQGLAKALELVQSDRFDLLVLDEVNSSTALGFLDEQAVLDLLEKIRKVRINFDRPQRAGVVQTKSALGVGGDFAKALFLFRRWCERRAGFLKLNDYNLLEVAR